MKDGLSGKVVVITGGARGIGAACARAFLSEGANVVICSRTQKEVSQVALMLSEEFGRNRIVGTVADISDQKAVAALFELSSKRFGPIDVLVNNAAVLELIKLTEMTANAWDALMNVNLRGAFLTSQMAFKQMILSGRGGAIVNVSSLGGIQGTQKFVGLSAYTASKAGLIGLSEALAEEGKEYGIRVNCIAPGAVQTQMLAKVAPHLKSNTTPEALAKAIVFLADDSHSSAVTGTIMAVHSNI